MSELREMINSIEIKEYLSADKNVTKNTVQTRTLQKVMRVLNKTNDDLKKISTVGEEVMYVHPHVSAYLSRHVPATYPVFDIEEMQLAARIYSTDYHDAVDLLKFCNLLDAKIHDPEMRHHVNIAFGFDGFYGTQLVRYVENLRYGMQEEKEAYDREPEDSETRLRIAHLRAVRHLYEKFGVSVSVDTLNTAVRDAFDGAGKDEARHYAMSRRYVDFVGTLFLDIASLYRAPDNLSVD